MLQNINHGSREYRCDNVNLNGGDKLLGIDLIKQIYYDSPEKGGKRPLPFSKSVLHAGGQRFKSSTAHHSLNFS